MFVQARIPRIRWKMTIYSVIWQELLCRLQPASIFSCTIFYMTYLLSPSILLICYAKPLSHQFWGEIDGIPTSGPSWSIKVSIAAQKFATSILIYQGVHRCTKVCNLTDWKGSDTTWELRMHPDLTWPDLTRNRKVIVAIDSVAIDWSFATLLSTKYTWKSFRTISYL